MTRSNILVAMTFGLLLASGCGRAEFKEYTSAAGNFKVQMPGSPKEESQSAKAPTGETMNLNVASVQQKDGVYVVMWSDLPIPAGESEKDIQTRLDGSRDGALRNINGKLTDEKKITIGDKHPGRDIQADLPNGKGSLRARIYLVGTRLYQVMVVGTSSWVSSADALKFLDSFALTK